MKKQVNQLLKLFGDLFRGLLLSHFWDRPVVIGLSLAFLSIPFHFGTLSLFNLPENDKAVIQSFIEWFGVPYGLLIALVLVNVWNQFETVNREFDREADAISMLYETVLLVQNDEHKLTECRKQIIHTISNYVKHVINSFRYEHENDDVRKKGEKFLKMIREVVGQVIHSKEKETVCAELLRQLHEAVDVRGDRISHSSQRMPGTLWVLALSSSALWLTPFYMLNFENDWIGYILLAGVTFVVVGLLAVIWDLNDPFGGTWKINIDSWEELHNHLIPMK